jgi:hypothetical protein
MQSVPPGTMSENRFPTMSPRALPTSLQNAEFTWLTTCSLPCTSTSGSGALNFEHSFWCKGVGGYATAKTSPFGKEHHLTISGTKLREMLAAGQYPPAEIVRPELAEILMAYSGGK